MKLCYAHLYYNPENLSLPLTEYLDWVNLRLLPEAMVARGHRVHVVHLFPRDEQFVHRGVHYHFVSPGRLVGVGVRLAGRLRRRSLAGREVAGRPIKTIQALEPDVIHFHGTVLTLNLFLLLATMNPAGVPVILQYHGGSPARRGWRHLLERINFKRVSRFLFTTKWHTQTYVDAGVLAADDPRVVELMEVSTPFHGRSRAEARCQTGMTGNPVFLWTGRLHPVKDPLTALSGFAEILAAWPDAQLYLHYLTTEMLPELQRFVSERPGLARHIHFRGRMPRSEMENVYNSADFFLQASHREYSGFAVLEAMACGVIPVVTDIPALRMMTGGGRYGILFPPGDVAALVKGVLAVDQADLPRWSAAVQQHFNEQFSFPAIASQLETIYEQVLREKGGL